MKLIRVTDSILDFQYDDKSNIKDVEVKPRAGDMIIFPSFIDHKVSPVTKGIRYSIVAWFGGPPFK